MSAQESHDVYEERKKEFLYEINKSGKYHILKERMKKTVVRIVKEHFGKKGTIKGLHKNSKDRFYSELYVFLVQEMRKTVQDMVECEQNELHENVTIPNDQGERERDHIIEKHTGETTAQRNSRLAFEEEFLKNDSAKAAIYLQEQIKSNEGDAQILRDQARFYLRQRDLEKAEQFLRDAYAFQLEDQPTALAYACLLNIHILKNICHTFLHRFAFL